MGSDLIVNKTGKAVHFNTAGLSYLILNNAEHCSNMLKMLSITEQYWPIF